MRGGCGSGACSSLRTPLRARCSDSPTRPSLTPYGSRHSASTAPRSPSKRTPAASPRGGATPPSTRREPPGSEPLHNPSRECAGSTPVTTVRGSQGDCPRRPSGSARPADATGERTPGDGSSTPGGPTTGPSGPIAATRATASRTPLPWGASRRGSHPTEFSTSRATSPSGWQIAPIASGGDTSPSEGSLPRAPRTEETGWCAEAPGRRPRSRCGAPGEGGAPRTPALAT